MQLYRGNIKQCVIPTTTTIPLKRNQNGRNYLHLPLYGILQLIGTLIYNLMNYTFSS